MRIKLYPFRLLPCQRTFTPLGARFSSRGWDQSQPSKSYSDGSQMPLADYWCSIVFVHGLCGHRRETWTKDGVCWPRELLLKEEALSHVRVLAFGYDANIVNLNGSTSLNTLFEHSINLLNALSRERRQDAVSLFIFRVPVRIHIHLARSSFNLSCALARRTDSERCMDI